MADIKTVRPAEVGFDALDPQGAPDDLDGLRHYASAALGDAEACFALPQHIEFERKDDLILFESPGVLDRAVPNGLARARLFEARGRDRAVVLLPFWNSRRGDVALLGRALAACGITCLQLSLPYHDERQTPGEGFAREMACENLGLTLAANLQAVREARACLTFLERDGYRRLGIVGISMGASLTAITAAVDARIRAAAMLLIADDFAEVVWTGSATRHVRQCLEQRFGFDDVKEAWRPISPATYASRLARRLDRVLIVSGAIDPVFLPELTQRYVERLQAAGGHPLWARFGCGHYTLGSFPYSLRTLWRTVSYLRTQL